MITTTTNGHLMGWWKLLALAGNLYIMKFLMQYVLVILRGGVPMSFGGTEEPAAYAELVSIGGINPANNKKVSAAISEIFEAKLSVPSSRFYIKFYDVKVDIIFLYACSFLSLPVCPFNRALFQQALV
jgi:hypothetical protein